MKSIWEYNRTEDGEKNGRIHYNHKFFYNHDFAERSFEKLNKVQNLLSNLSYLHYSFSHLKIHFSNFDSSELAEQKIIKSQIKNTILKNPSANLTNEKIDTYLNSWINSMSCINDIKKIKDDVTNLIYFFDKIQSNILKSKKQYLYKSSESKMNGPQSYQDVENLILKLESCSLSIQNFLQTFDNIEKLANDIENLVKTKDLNCHESQITFSAELIAKTIPIYRQCFPNSEIQFDYQTNLTKPILSSLFFTNLVTQIIYWIPQFF